MAQYEPKVCPTAEACYEMQAEGPQPALALLDLMRAITNCAATVRHVTTKSEPRRVWTSDHCDRLAVLF